MLGPSEGRFTSATLREADRIRALEEYRIIGSPADPDLDHIDGGFAWLSAFCQQVNVAVTL